MKKLFNSLFSHFFHIHHGHIVALKHWIEVTDKMDVPESLQEVEIYKDNLEDSFIGKCYAVFNEHGWYTLTWVGTEGAYKNLEFVVDSHDKWHYIDNAA